MLTQGRRGVFKHGGLLVFVGWWLAVQWVFFNIQTGALSDAFRSSKEALFYLGGGMLVLYQLWRCRKNLNFAFSPPIIFISLYLLSAIASIVFALGAQYEGLIALARIILWIGLVWSLSQFESSHLKTIIQCSVFSAAMIAVLNWLQLLGFNIWPYPDSSFPAPIGHISYYGDFMALHIPLALWLFADNAKRTRKTFWGVCLFLVTLGLWISETRASIAGFLTAALVAVVLLISFRLKSWKTLLIYTVGFMGLVFFIATIQPTGLRASTPIERFGTIITSVPQGNLATATPDRWTGYKNTLKMIVYRPWLGFGLGSFRFVYPEYAKGASVSASVWYMHPHNEFLSQAAEMGVAGLAAFLGVFGSFFASAVFYLRKSSNTNRSKIILGLVGLTISFVSWQFSTTFTYPVCQLLTALFAAILWKELSPQIRPLFTITPSRLISVLLIAVFSISTLTTTAYSASLYATRHAQDSAGAEKLMWARRAYSLAPGAFDPWYVYTTARLQTETTEEVLPMVDRLHAQYPYVPVVLFMTALTRLHTGRVEEARALLAHAIKNDPTFETAKKYLKGLEDQP